MLEFFVSYEDKSVRRSLDRLPRDVADLNATALGRVAEGIVAYSIDKYFRPGRDEAGPNMQKGPGSLRRVTGVLANSIAKEMDGPWGVKIGASARYARVHEEGAQIGPRKIPARPYLRPAIEDWFETPVAQRVFDREFRKLQRRFNR